MRRYRQMTHGRNSGLRPAFLTAGARSRSIRVAMMIRAVAFAAAFLLAGAALPQTPSGTDTPAVEAAPAEPKQGTEAPAEGTAPAETEAEPSARPGGKPPVPEFQRRSGQRSGGPANDLNTPDSRARERLPGGSVTDTVC